MGGQLPRRFGNVPTLLFSWETGGKFVPMSNSCSRGRMQHVAGRRAVDWPYWILMTESRKSQLEKKRPITTFIVKNSPAFVRCERFALPLVALFIAWGLFGPKGFLAPRAWMGRLYRLVKCNPFMESGMT